MMRIPLILAVACVTSAELVATNYCAQFSPSEANKTTGYFAMQIYGGVATYSYNLDLTNFNTKCEIASKGMVNIQWNLNAAECD